MGSAVVDEGAAAEKVKCSLARCWCCEHSTCLSTAMAPSFSVSVSCCVYVEQPQAPLASERRPNVESAESGSKTVPQFLEFKRGLYESTSHESRFFLRPAILMSHRSMAGAVCVAAQRWRLPCVCCVGLLPPPPEGWPSK